MKIHTIVFILTILLFGCDSQNSSTNTNSAEVKPSPKPTLSKEEAELRDKESNEEKLKAIDDFIPKNYKGWQYKGWSNGAGECEENSGSVCDLLLSKGDQEKIVPVMLKRFTDVDGKERLVVFEARSVDLSKAKINSIKEAEKDFVLGDLTIDDVSDDLKAEIVQQDKDTETENQKEYGNEPDYQ